MNREGERRAAKVDKESLFSELITAFGNACYACGEWRHDDDDEGKPVWNAVFVRYQETQRALTEEILAMMRRGHPCMRTNECRDHGAVWTGEYGDSHLQCLRCSYRWQVHDVVDLLAIIRELQVEIAKLNHTENWPGSK